MDLKKDFEFLEYLKEWYQKLPIASWNSLMSDHPPEFTAIISVDVVNGFANKGNLSSPRIATIVPAIVDLFRRAQKHGIEEFLLLQDTHPSNSKEFLIYPPHCMEGTNESVTVPELMALSGSNRFQIMPKKTINPGIEDNFRNWMNGHSHFAQFILVGDCTDICVHLIAIFLKSWQVRHNKEIRVVVPANCVDTYDVPVQAAQKGTLPHPAEFLHVLFLYHMQLNGVRIVHSIE